MNASGSQPAVRTRPVAATFILVGGFAFLLFSMALSASFGAADIKLATVWTAVFHYNPDLTSHQIIHVLRLPRIVASALVGAGFAVAGALMQGMTRNPMADSGLLGLNAGAGFVLALCLALAPGMTYNLTLMFCFIGAGIGAALVFGIGSLAKGGLTPVRLVLVGSAVSLLLHALSQGVALYYRVGQDLAFWFAGGTASVRWLQIEMLLPWIGIAIAAAVMLSPSITLLSLGEDIATNLGQRTRLVRIAAIAIVLVLAGASVSVVGAVSFVGLIVPHVTRYLVGVDYRWIIPCSAMIGGVLVVLADLASRMINPLNENVPIGAVIALVGVPFFLYLARHERRGL